MIDYIALVLERARRALEDEKPDAGEESEPDLYARAGLLKSGAAQSTGRGIVFLPKKRVPAEAAGGGIFMRRGAGEVLQRAARVAPGGEAGGDITPPPWGGEARNAGLFASARPRGPETAGLYDRMRRARRSAEFHARGERPDRADLAEGRAAAASALDAAALDRAFERDARRYDGGYVLF